MTNPTATSLQVSGTGVVSVPDGNVTVESTRRPAADLSSSGRVIAAEIGNAGDWKTSGSASFSVAPTHTLADDLGSFAPAPGGTPVTTTGSAVQTISPGTYSSISASSTSAIHLLPGVYVVTGSVTASGGAHIDGTGVTLVVPAGCVTVSGPSLVSFVDSAVSADRVVVSGSSVLSITGGPVTPPPPDWGGGIV